MDLSPYHTGLEWVSTTYPPGTSEKWKYRILIGRTTMRYVVETHSRPVGYGLRSTRGGAEVDLRPYPTGRGGFLTYPPGTSEKGTRLFLIASTLGLALSTVRVVPNSVTLLAWFDAT